MKMVQLSAQTLPLFVGKPGERAPPLCGAIPAESNYVAKVGDNVAALAKGIEDEENWILAEVVQFLHRQNKYDVIDIDEEQKDRHVLSKRKVIPLPLMRANPETDGHALFPKDTIGKLGVLNICTLYKLINLLLISSHGTLSTNHLLLQGNHQQTTDNCYWGLRCSFRGFILFEWLCGTATRGPALCDCLQTHQEGWRQWQRQSLIGLNYILKTTLSKIYIYNYIHIHKLNFYLKYS